MRSCRSWSASSTTPQVFEIAVIENVQRDNLNAIEEGRAPTQQLIEMFEAAPRKRSRAAVGKSRSHVANTLRLMNPLPKPVQVARAGRPADRRSCPGAYSPPTTRRPSPTVIIGKGLSVREAESLARATPSAADQASTPRRKPAKDTDTQALESDLADALGLERRGGRPGRCGELRIKYATLEQLDELCRKLTSRG